MSLRKGFFRAILGGFTGGAGVICIIIGHPWWAWVLGLILIVITIIIYRSLHEFDETEKHEDIEEN